MKIINVFKVNNELNEVKNLCLIRRNLYRILASRIPEYTYLNRNYILTYTDIHANNY